MNLVLGRPSINSHMINASFGGLAMLQGNVRLVGLISLVLLVVISVKIKAETTVTSSDETITETTLEDTTEYVDVTDEDSELEWTTQLVEPIASSRVLNCTECKCGGGESLGKIVGGDPAGENSYPWMAALYYNNRFTCGGSLITDRYILTAAHCVIRQDPARFRIQLLVHNRNQPNTNSVERSVKAIKTFFFNSISNNNDIGLLEMTFPVTISDDRLIPICLPQADDTVYEGKNAIVTGWGRTAVGSLSDTLEQLEVPILSNKNCRRTGYWAFRITNKMLCAGFVEGGRDSCQGDSGGPLQVFNNETRRYEIVGIVSWGRACAQKNFPGVYTRVSRFLRWIKNNTKDSCICN